MATRAKTATSSPGWELPSDQKVLLLLRHAKSDWDTGLADHERPLNLRGHRDAVGVGQRIAAARVEFDLVVSSTAIRTRQTWEQVVVGGARSHEVRYLDQIYAAEVADLVAVVRALPEAATSVLLIGHAPGVPDLVEILGSRTADPAWARLDSGYPTAGLTALTLAGPWSSAHAGCAQLVAFEVPRG